MPLTEQEREQIRSMLRAPQSQSGESERMKRLRALTPQPTQTKPDGFWSGLAKSMATPFAELGTSALNLGETVYDIARGDSVGAAQALKKTRNVPFLGQTKPAFTGDETFGEEVKKVTGYGAEIASYMPFGRGVSAIVQGAKGGLVKRSTVQGLKEGATGGFLSGIARPLQENKGSGEVLAGGAFGTALGAGFGSVIGAGIGTVGLGIQRALEKPGTTAVRKVSEASKRYAGVFGANRKQVNLLDDFAKDTGEDLPEYLVSHGIPLETTDGGRKFSTKFVGEKFRDDVGGTLENHLQEVLGSYKGSKTIDLKKAITEVGRKIDLDDSLLEVEKDQQKRIITQYLKKEIGRVGDIIDTVEANIIKRKLWRVGYDVLRPQKNRALRRLGGVIREYIERSVDDPIVGDINKEIAKVMQASDFLESINGDAVKGGKVGPMFTRLVGGVAGSKFGPIASMATGEAMVRIMAKLGDVEALSEKAINQFRKAGIIPSSAKTMQEAKAFLINLARKRAKTLRLEAGAIQTPTKDASRLLNQKEAVERLGESAKIKPQVPRGQVLLPAKATPPSIELPSPGVLEGQRKLKKR